jgi:hypothetical protein
MPATTLNTAIVRLLKRAEEEDPATLAETFVDINALFARLSSRDSQVMFGRRGTGKTHALMYLQESLRADGETVVYLDLRLLGSSGGIYSDQNVEISEAGTRLLVDVLQSTYDALVDQAFEESTTNDSGSDQLLSHLDALSEAIGNVEVVGETEDRTSTGVSGSSQTQLGINVAPLSAFARTHEGKQLAAEREVILRGVSRQRVHFGSVAAAFRKLIPNLPGKRLWLIMDEWSHVPMDLQPLLADLIRHCLLPIPGVTVKVAAIENRSVFHLYRGDGGYTGIELGADMAADINLDEFMVFTAAGDGASDFFAQLFQRHIRAASDGDKSVDFGSPEEFIEAAFSSEGAFHELVRAAEGVPRDAINVLSKAALHASDRRISLRDMREAARAWYLNDKESILRTKPAGRALLHWVIDHVIGRRRIRGFLLRQDSESHLIEWLYDARLIHLIKRSLAAKDQPGVRFDAFAVDYGCYVDLLNTRGAGPRGLFVVGDDNELSVPDDDLERMRGAILDLDEFAQSEAAGIIRRTPPEVTVKGHVRDATLTVESPVALGEDPPASEWSLLVESRDGITVVPIGARPTKVGSSSNDHVRVRADKVEARHAVIEISNEAPVLTADGGAVYVNDLKISIRQLVHRDHISIGGADLLVYSRTAAAQERQLDKA